MLQMDLEMHAHRPQRAGGSSQDDAGTISDQPGRSKMELPGICHSVRSEADLVQKLSGPGAVQRRSLVNFHENFDTLLAFFISSRGKILMRGFYYRNDAGILHRLKIVRRHVGIVEIIFFDGSTNN